MESVFYIGGAVLVIASIGVWLLIRYYNKAIGDVELKCQDEARKEEATQLLYKKEQVSRKAIERTFKQKRQFYSNIFQELKTPLVSITGYAEMLRISGNDFDESDNNNVGRLILNNAHRMTDILNKLIDLSHYELLQELPLNDKVTVNELCQEIVGRYQGYAHEGVELRFVTGLEDDYVVHTNKDCLVKALCHLMDAAFRHTNKGLVTLSAINGGHLGYVTFMVSDTGFGIPKQYHNSVFEVLPDMGTELKLSGLDLMISRTIVRLLGGVMYVDPHYDIGTCVVFDISV